MLFFYVSYALPQTAITNPLQQLDATCGVDSKTKNYPLYSPEIYNDPEYVRVNNCYAYAFPGSLLIL